MDGNADTNISTLAAPSISLWEAHAKGNATIQQVEISPGDSSGFLVRNLGLVEISIDERAMLLSPHPLDAPGIPTTQDGVITSSTVRAGGVRLYYGSWDGRTPIWYCTEEYQVVQGGPFIKLGGEILPYTMSTIIDTASSPWPDGQNGIWEYMRENPTLVVGKTPLWSRHPDTPGTKVPMTLAITNLAIYDSSSSNGSNVKAVDSIIRDTLPSGYSYDPASFSLMPNSIISNPDGSTTLLWKVTIPAADVNGHDILDPTPYNFMIIKYKLVLPALSVGRHMLPRLTTDTNHDGAIDAHSAQPILDIYHVNRPPIPDAGGPYVAFEGQSVAFDGRGSYDPDDGPSHLQLRWDFENDGIWDTPWMSVMIYTHTYGDDFVGQIAVEVTDGMATAKDVANITILNVLPSGSVVITSVQEEGSPIQFSAHVTDPGSDDLFLKWTWGFGAPDEHSTYYNNGVSPDPYPSTDVHPRDITDVKSHTYGDNGAFVVTVFVRDDDSGSTGTTLTITATPNNLPPSVSVSGGLNIDEGQSVSLTADSMDPGSDDLTFTWTWGDGSSETRTYYNDGSNPDPPNSPGGTFPFSASDSATHPYGDNGAYTITLFVSDDDGGSVTWIGQAIVANLPPSITTFGPFSFDEGTSFTLSSDASDPGSDDLTFSWSFEMGPAPSNTYYNNGVSPDPPQSPGGTYPFSATDTVSHTYGDNGDFVVTLTVTDDDGGSVMHTTTITVVNVAPSITSFGPFAVNEADPLTVTSDASDPGSDDLTFTWTFEYGPTTVNLFYNDGINPDPAKSPDGTFPFDVTDSASHIYGDNGVFIITLTVEDDDGGVTTAETTVTVHNLPPTILDARAFALANISIRVAGEKWHDVILRLFRDGREVGYAQVIRYPGSPDEQIATVHGVEITLDGLFSAVVYYTPDDDPINGQPNGANPVWLIVEWESGEPTRIHHTFNVKHPDTWVWTVDSLYVYALGKTIHLAGSASDPGSDDLTFDWASSDGRTFTTITYNNGVSPDPYPSPDVNPITATSDVTLVYTTAGTFTITLTVTDDDGASTTYSFTIRIGA